MPNDREPRSVPGHELLQFIGVVYNLIAVGLVIMVFVIFVPRGLAGLSPFGSRRVLRRDVEAGEGG